MTSGKKTAFVNADVTTLDPSRPRGRGLVVEGGAIAHLLDERPTAIAAEMEVVDCQGAAIVPGFHDCHVHLTDSGLLAGDHDMSGCTTVGAMLEQVRALHDDVLFAGNYEEERISERRAPLITELDAVAPDRPVLLTRVDGHSCVVNSAALDLIGVMGHEGVERGDDGLPTGRLFGPANYAGQGAFFAHIPDAVRESADVRAAAIALREGITTVHHVIAWEASLEALEEQYRRDAAQPIRVISKTCTTDVGKARRLGNRVFGGDIFVDGSIGSRTAAVGHGYLDGHGDGLLYLDREQLAAMFEEAAESGLSVGVHAIGDRAIEAAIAAWETVIERRGPLQGVRPSIDHFEIASPSQIARAARCGMLLSMQPAFDALWGGTNGMYAERFGAERALEMNLFRTAKRAGCTVCGGSDSPITPFSALYGIHSLVNHHVPAERFTVEEALRAYCADAARLSFDEGRRGTLAPGMEADFVLLEKALDAVPPQDIAKTRVLATVIAGEIRYRAA